MMYGSKESVTVSVLGISPSPSNAFVFLLQLSFIPSPFALFSFLVCRTASLPLCLPSESSEELSPGTQLPLLLLLPPIPCAPASGNRRTNHPSAQSAHLCSDTTFSAIQPSSPSGHHRECALTDCRLSWSMLDFVQGE